MTPSPIHSLGTMDPSAQRRGRVRYLAVAFACYVVVAGLGTIFVWAALSGLTTNEVAALAFLLMFFSAILLVLGTSIFGRFRTSQPLGLRGDKLFMPGYHWWNPKACLIDSKDVLAVAYGGHNVELRDLRDSLDRRGRRLTRSELEKIDLEWHSVAFVITYDRVIIANRSFVPEPSGLKQLLPGADLFA